MMVPLEKAPAKLVPAAAVIRVVLALFGFIGRKGCVNGVVSLLLNSSAQPRSCNGNCYARGWKREVEFLE
jgi:hypothetical protein